MEILSKILSDITKNISILDDLGEDELAMIMKLNVEYIQKAPTHYPKLLDDESYRQLFMSMIRFKDCPEVVKPMIVIFS